MPMSVIPHNFSISITFERCIDAEVSSLLQQNVSQDVIEQQEEVLV